MPVPLGRTDQVSSKPIERRDIDGILLLDKPPGCSSNQALQAIKRQIGAKKAGHTGSLDPLATGMLPLCFGEATKFSSFLLDSDKTYRVRPHFGVRTSTGDAEGEILTRGGDHVHEVDLLAALKALTGPIEQIPPMYSALKYQGKPLYKFAREGKEVTRAPRRVIVRELSLERFDPREPELRVWCSKGTYIRTLMEDLAARLGTVAHVVLLRRLWVGPFQDTPMHTSEEVASAALAGPVRLAELLLPIDHALRGCPRVLLSQDEAWQICRGQPILPTLAPPLHGLVCLYEAGGGFLGVGEGLADGRVLPRRLLKQGDVVARTPRGL
jgi:tRNA pseudouridine55 synthase